MGKKQKKDKPIRGTLDGIADQHASRVHRMKKPYLQGRNRYTDIENRLGDTVGKETVGHLREHIH